MDQQNQNASSEYSDQHELAMALARISTQRKSFVPRFIGFCIVGMLVGGVLAQLVHLIMSSLN